MKGEEARMADDLNAPVIVPNPDPSNLTNDKIRNDLAALEHQLSERISGVRSTIDARLGAMDKAADLFDANLNRIPTLTDREVGHLREVHEEKFFSIQRQFVERDTRVEQTARDTKVAVDAALQAAEKAVGKQNESFALSIAKSEAATTKQIDQQVLNLQTTASGLDSKIIDVKDRITRLESQAVGQINADNKHTAATSTQNSSTGLIIGTAGVLVAVVSVVLSVVLHAATGTH